MSKLKVCIVDDAASIRVSLRKMLSILDYIEITGEADSVKSAKILLSNNEPDLTLLDLNLPDGSGYDILKVIKESKNPHKVIILTNYSAESYKKKALKEGADHFFDKSTEFEKVIDVIVHLTK
jgi:DNA-binding NarL/FixJ family response regulator